MRRYITFIQNNKTIILPFLYLSLLILGVFVFNLFVVDYIDGFKVYVNQKEIALVKDYEVIHSILASLEQEIESQHELDIVFDEYLLKYQKTESTLDNFTSLTSLEQSLKENVTYKCKCWSLVINGKEAVYLKEKDNVEKLIKDLRNYYLPVAGNNNEKISIKDVKILESFTIEPAHTYYPEILSEENAFTFLLEGTMEKVTYRVKSGDNLYSIARDFRLDPNTLEEANPNIDPRRIQVGDEINISMAKPLLNVEISYQHVYEEIIPAPIIVKRDNTMLRTQTVVEEPGESGNKRVFAEIVLNNGFIKTREVSMEEILKTPKLRILKQGTQRTPDDILVSSTFLPPGIGIITSRYGVRRWNKIHTGIDVAVGTGTNVHAYRAGTIKFAGWNPWGYGNLVIIDHGNGIETYYAHNSVIKVEVGDSVTKGQTIALSGNTGISTGPHVHFEVRVNGQHINPLPFLRGQ
ncbi:MAG: M23 family metallopeptidase [Spirochaetales bacterium]|nr:M23 family metallopeptidase [Spirochaetales bacterium]